MNEKRTSLSATQLKNRQKSNCNEEKLDVISRLQKGERIVDMWRNVRPGRSNIRTVGGNVRPGRSNIRTVGGNVRPGRSNIRTVGGNADRITESAKCLENINVNDLNQGVFV
jgi:hypothetical protein